MPQFVKVGALYERLGEEAVNEIAAWLDQVYDSKAEMDALRRDVKELLRDVRAMHCKLPECRAAAHELSLPGSPSEDVENEPNEPAQYEQLHHAEEDE